MDKQPSDKLKALINLDSLQSMLDNNEVKLLFTNMAFPVNNSGIVNSDRCIPNSTFFDFENVFTDINSSTAHMLPSQESFSINMSLLGIKNEDVLVVYDNQGLFSAPRVWWMLKCMGHQQVYILNGGLKAWLEAGKESVPLNKLQHKATNKSEYKAHFHSELCADKQEVLKAISNNNMRIFDARGVGRFKGTEPEPRQGVRSGHIPTAVNLHYAKLSANGYLKERSELQLYFDELVSEPPSKWLFTCGSGVTACILALAAHELGIEDWAVYDGSWSEWGADHDLPIAT